MAAVSPVTANDVKEARERIKAFVHKTPVMTCATLDAIASTNTGSPVKLLFKCENFQRIGAFKFRGATNSIRSLLFPTEGLAPRKEQLVVITHSSGNHAQALALSAQQQGVTCHVVMPNNAPAVKKDAVKGYGAVVTESEPTLQAREDTVAQITERLKTSDPSIIVEFISPYNDPRVIAGQGTLALEAIEQADELENPLDVLITPVGGGGLLSGCATAAKGVNPNIWVVGAEPLGADDAYRSFNSKTLYPSVNPKTIADGLLTSLGSNTFPLILQHVNAIHTVTEEEILRATKLVYERMKIVIEPSAAVSLAVALYSKEFVTSMKTLRSNLGRQALNIGIVFSGGNVDIINLARLFETLDA